MKLIDPNKPLNPEELERLSSAANVLGSDGNLFSFTNFNVETKMKQTARGEKEIEVRIPKTINVLVDDLYKRMGEFPRLVGDELFAIEDGQIKYLFTKDDLKAWTNATIGLQSEFQGGSSFVSWAELFARLHQTAIKYDSTTASPWWPTREDVFYMGGDIPPPTANHRAFWSLIDFFCPADAANKTLLAAAFVAPLWYSPNGDKPLVVIDTRDAQGSGKTSLVEAVASLYGGCMDVASKDLDRKEDEIKKRLLSSEGRKSRLVLLDNVTGKLKSDLLANFVTAGRISGRPCYGRGEESRANDLTFFATVNGAELDTDMAVRCYAVTIRKPERRDPMWKANVKRYIENNRAEIFADMIEMLENAPYRVRPDSRFGMFDRYVLSAVCSTDDEFNAASVAITGASEAANADNEIAEQFKTMVEDWLARCPDYDSSVPAVIFKNEIERIMSVANPPLKYQNFNYIKNTLVKGGRLPEVSKTFRALPDIAPFRNDRAASILYGVNRVGGDEKRVIVQLVKYEGGEFKVIRGEINRPKEDK